MHHNVLLVVAGLICSPIFAAPNVNNRLHARKGHRQRQVTTAYQPPSYGPPPDESVAPAAETSTGPPDSTSVISVDPLLPPIPTTSSACSVIRITEYVTVYGTSSSASSPSNFTSAPPYGMNSSVIPSSLLTGTAVTTTTTTEPYFPISNSTTLTPPGTGEGTSAPTFVNITTTVNSTALPTSALVNSTVVPTSIFVNSTSLPTTIFVNSTAVPTSIFVNSTFLSTSILVNSTVLPVIPTSIPVNSTVLPVIPTSIPVVPSNFTSFPNISTSVIVTPVPLPYPTSVSIPGNFTSFANVTSTVEVSVLPIPISSSANVTSVPASTTAEEPSSAVEPTGVTGVTSIIVLPTETILPTETTVVVPGVTSTTSTITSLVIDPSETPIETATETSATSSPTLVIVTTLTPIATASATLSDLPTTVITATNTVSSDNAPTGTPSPSVLHCGIRGVALGTYYLATYAYNRANVPVTLQGCYQFCSVAVEQCFSYEFYLEPGLGSPRCKLYGGLVSYEVTSIDPFQPYQWFDLACGDPTKFGT